jgi:hypothetical protein
LLLAPGTDFAALDLTQKRAKMKTILEEKIKSIEDDAWKLMFKERESAIKDAVEPVVGIIEVRLTELDDYVEGHDVLCFHLVSLPLVPLFWYRNLRYARLVAKDYVGPALESSSYGSLAWSGVCLLPPVSPSFLTFLESGFIMEAL